MLTFTSLGTGSFKIVGGDKPVIAFPPSLPAGDSAVTLMATPQEGAPGSVISWPGEYHQAGISIRGIGHLEGQQVSYVLELDGVRVGVLSSPLQDWSDKQLESVGDIDVLAVPAGEPKLVQKLVDEFDPRILLLIPGKDAGSLGAVEKVIGVKEHAAEYKVKGLPSEGREVIVLA